MGVAAYNRGSRALSRRIDEELTEKRVMKSETRERLRRGHAEAAKRRIASQRKELEELTEKEGPLSLWADMLAAHIDRHGKVLPE